MWYSTVNIQISVTLCVNSDCTHGDVVEFNINFGIMTRSIATDWWWWIIQVKQCCLAAESKRKLLSSLSHKLPKLPIPTVQSTV